MNTLESTAAFAVYTAHLPTRAATRTGRALALVWIGLMTAALVLSGTVAAQSSNSEETKPIAPEAAGAVAACTVCHGTDGEGNERLNAPRIGGLADWYVTRQLRHFRQGIRGATDEDIYGSQMRAITLMLGSEEAVDGLGRYMASLSPPPAPETVSGDAARGEQLYTVCTACHGEDGLGSKELNTPSLIGQHDWYLVRQLEYYKNGLRGAHKSDTYGMQMVPIMQTLQDRQAILDVVAYINTL
jgi:cytochrome c oxidase subunit 2